MTIRPIAYLVVTTVFLALPNSISAQRTAAGFADTEPVEDRVSIEFAGGTVKEYCDQISKSSGINIVITKSAGTYLLPEIGLKNVSTGAALNALNYATNGVIEMTDGDYGEIIYVVRRGSEIPTEVSVHNVKNLLAQKSKEDLFSAIEIGLGMLDAGTTKLDPDMLQLHDETGLMFVKGTEQQLLLIDSIIHELITDLHRSSNRGGGGAGGAGLGRGGGEAAGLGGAGGSAGGGAGGGGSGLGPAGGVGGGRTSGGAGGGSGSAADDGDAGRPGGRGK